MIKERIFTAKRGGKPNTRNGINNHENNGEGDIKRLMNPSNETAISAWEDPIPLTIKNLRPGAARGSIKGRLKIMGANFYPIARTYESFSPLAITILIGYLLLILKPVGTMWSSRDALYPLVTVLLFTAGFTPFFVEMRYLWFVSLLLILMGGRLLVIMFQSDFFTPARKTMALTLFVLCSIAMPSKALIKGMDTEKKFYSVSQILDNRHQVEGNIASNLQWVHTLFLTFHLKGKYYGTTGNAITDENLEAVLDDKDIDFYFIWGMEKKRMSFLSRYKEIAIAEMPDLRIYSLKELNRIDVKL